MQKDAILLLFPLDAETSTQMEGVRNAIFWQEKLSASSLFAKFCQEVEKNYKVNILVKCHLTHLAIKMSFNPLSTKT